MGQAGLSDVQAIMNQSQHREYSVGSDEKGLRLDLFLSRRDPFLSRSQVQKLIEKGAVRLGDHPAKAGQRLREGETVHCEIPPVADYHVLPEDIPLPVIYEDESILVVDKPTGMVVHPAAGHPRGPMVNAILFHCRDLSGIGGVLRPGIVHRLDKDTSGLMIVAKSDRAHQGLTDQFRKRQIQKTYQALVYGNMKADQGFIDLPVGRHPVDRKRMSTSSRRGKEAITHWRVCERYGEVTLLHLNIETGRTHQIRVHLNAIGHPVVGDSVYGGTKRVHTIGDPVLRSALKGLKRQALHAAHLCFNHPITGNLMTFSSSLPEDMVSVCEVLRCSTSLREVP
jgi:23S rRNA pseudouridine1911/1915/1917 synthase